MMKTKPSVCVLSCFVPGKQLTSAVTNAFSQMQSVLGRRKWAGSIVVLVPWYSILHWLYILILFWLPSATVLQFGCLSLISWYHFRQLNAKHILSTHCLGFPHPESWHIPSRM